METVERATERITVLMTPLERRALEAKARAAGMTISDFVRRSVDGYDPDAASDLDQLAALSAELRLSNKTAELALDGALDSVRQTLAALRARRET